MRQTTGAAIQAAVDDGAHQAALEHSSAVVGLLNILRLLVVVGLLRISTIGLLRITPLLLGLSTTISCIARLHTATAMLASQPSIGSLSD